MLEIELYILCLSNAKHLIFPWHHFSLKNVLKGAFSFLMRLTSHSLSYIDYGSAERHSFSFRQLFILLVLSYLRQTKLKF